MIWKTQGERLRRYRGRDDKRVDKEGKKRRNERDTMGTGGHTKIRGGMELKREQWEARRGCGVASLAQD